MRRTSAFAVAALATALLPASASAGSLTLEPGDHTWTVPGGVTEATFDLSGSAAEGRFGDPVGGRGGRVSGTLAVTPSETLRVVVGTYGTNGAGSSFNFKAGGATDVRRPTAAEGDEERLLVAGGGGGWGETPGQVFPGGDAGSGPTGGDGLQGVFDNACSGGGATDTSGGKGGQGGFVQGRAGTRGQGGDSMDMTTGAGAGGGGWFGGGSGGVIPYNDAAAFCPGGGGSSYAPGGTLLPELNEVVGAATITWTDIPPSTSPATEVTADTATLNGTVFAPVGEKWIVQVQHKLASGGSWTSSPRRGAAEDGAVSVPVSGLQVDTLYGFRLLVTKPDGSRVTTATRTFRTKAPLPSLGDLSLVTADPLVPRRLDLRADYDTRGYATSFVFSYRRSGTETWKATSPVSVGAGREVVSFTKTLTALKSGAHYEIAITARTSGGETSLLQFETAQVL